MGSKAKTSKLPKLHKGKGKRWKKGHSSTSNPEKKKYRDAAKNRYFNKSSGPSMLTVDALAKHDKTEGEVDDDTITMDADQQTMGTFKTWATNWTECTNTTFNKVHRYWASNSALHKEILAVLAAITEVIKLEGGKETETEYFAALMTALETAEEEDSITAIVYLLSVVIKKVPVPVLRRKFSEVAKKLLSLLGKFADDDSTSLVKSLIMALCFLLRSQDAASWSDTSVQHVYRSVLTFIVHKKPKIRRAAHQGVCIVLKGSLFMLDGNCPPYHPASSMTAKHCIQLIETCGGMGEALDTLHTLTLLKQILHILPHNSMKSVCETILKVMTLSNVMVTAGAMQALHALFAAKPKTDCLPAELNAQIISALYDYQPSENDVQPSQAWLVVMETAHINMSRLDAKLCMGHLPRLFTAGMVSLLSVKSEITQAAAKSLKSVITHCITPLADSVGPMLAQDGGSSPIHKILKVLESGLGYQFHASWGLVLQLFAVLFESVGKYSGAAFKKTLATIADLRDSTRFPYKGELDHAVGCAVKSMGPRIVLTAIPLQITGQSDDLDFPRSWLLPVIRDNVQEAELGFFTSYFLPLAAKLRQRALELFDQQNLVASKSYEALQLQIWSLLPGFCTRPIDLSQSFKGIAKVLGTAISEREDLRMDVMASLRKLINQSLNDGDSKAEVAKFSKNFLPILFNLYTTDTRDKDSSILAVLETIKCYFQITDKPSVCTYCEKCREKLKEKAIPPCKRLALYDLLIAMLPYLNRTELLAVFNLSIDHLQDNDKSLQKKCYRILEEICSGKSGDCREFVVENLDTIQKSLLASLSSSSPSSKAPRLRCLVNVFQLLDTRQEDFLLAVVPEAILCTKEVAERARAASYNLLVEMGNTAVRWSEGSDSVLEEYFKMVMAGFAGSPLMISATLLALTRIMYEFKDRISGDMLESIIENVCLLLKSKSREVVQSALAFTKVTVSTFPVTTLAQHLKTIMSSLTSMKEDCHHHFRFKSKEVYTKLVRKFGYETIYNLSPEGIRKVLVNIRKTQERAKKKRKTQEEEESGDSDDETERFNTQPDSIDDLLKDSDSEPEDDQKNKSKGKKQKTKVIAKETGKAWLHEGGDDDITDFMDMSAAKKVMATKPVEKKAKKEDSGFKTAPDGRLIITESSEDEGGDSDEDEDIDDLLEALEKGRDTGKIKQTKKRKLEDLGGSDDEGASPQKYRAGGRGIHRPLNKPDKPDRKPVEYGAEYKSKKGGGDVKRKGKPDPYAYVPLDFKSLNKRKQAKVKGQFKNLVHGAKQGAAKGKKGKGKKK